MKKYIKILFLCAVIATVCACESWTEEKNSVYVDMSVAPKSDAYYAALREWKLNDDHPRTFGWFGNWTGLGARMENRLMGLPDSVDFVSMWGNWYDLSEDQMEDKRQAYEIKGLRVNVCFIIANIGDQLTPSEVRENYRDNGFSTEQAAVNDFWGWRDNDNEAIEAAIRRYASAIADTIVKYDFHGFDYDLERDYGASGNIASYSSRITILLDELSKTCGPKSGTNRLLCVDGQPNILEPQCYEYLDYFILQAYYATSYASLDGGSGSPRVTEVINNFQSVMSREEIVKRIILTEDFEQNAAGGGRAGTFTTRDGRRLPPVWGMADYYTADGLQIGGCGLYHMEYDYGNTYTSISTEHEGKGMDLSPALYTGQTCYGYLNGIINLLHNPVNPAKSMLE